MKKTKKKMVTACNRQQHNNNNTAAAVTANDNDDIGLSVAGHLCRTHNIAVHDQHNCWWWNQVPFSADLSKQWITLSTWMLELLWLPCFLWHAFPTVVVAAAVSSSSSKFWHAVLKQYHSPFAAQVVILLCHNNNSLSLSKLGQQQRKMIVRNFPILGSCHANSR